MSFLQQPFYLRDLALPNNIFYSPLAGCSDFPFRQMVSRFRPGLMYCEMVKMEALIRNDPNTFHLLDFDTEMHPIGAQIVGSNPVHAKQAAKIIEELGFDVVDFNCGCPVDKVTKDGSGSGMLRQPERIGEVISEIRNAVSIPVTVKIRSGWDDSHLNAPDIVEIAEQAGADAIAIHGRTRMQGYRGPADWDIIRECKERANQILIIGNGDVNSGESALKMFEQTNCDVVLASRATMGAPWIVEEIIRTLSEHNSNEKLIPDPKTGLRQHLELITEYQGERRAILDARRVGCWYIKSTIGTKEFRGRLSRVASLKEALDLIRELP